MIIEQNENNLIITYPKFLKKQASYLRGACAQRTKNRIEENRIDNTNTCHEPSKLDASPEKEYADKEKSLFKQQTLELLDRCWSSYPSIRRVGKEYSFNKVLTQCKTEADANMFFDAFEAYMSKQDELKTEPKYYKQFKVLINQWKDWVPNDTQNNG
jgi:hypothetical protein